MKRLIVSFSTLLLICAGFMLTSCKNDDDPLSMDVASGDLTQSFDMDAGTKSITVYANVSFTVSVEEAAKNWCSANAVSNITAVSAVSISVIANTGELRTAEVTLSAKGVPDVKITVTQTAKPPVIIPTKVFDHCESLDGWDAYTETTTLSLDGTDKKEGNYSISAICGKDLAFFMKSCAPFDPEPEVTQGKGYLAFDLYISDVSLMNNFIRIDLTSSGDAGAEDLIWNRFSDFNFVNGWNKVELSLANPHGGYTPIYFNEINFFRIVLIPLETMEVKIDHIRFYEK